MEYLRRTVDDELDDLLALAPAVAIDGPKGVGKTDTASRRASIRFLFDDPDHAALWQADPVMARVSSGTVLLDEWQRFPEVWDVVRRAVDAGAPAGRFLLTGSATPASAQGTHSGAGRILSLRMRPMAIHERGTARPTVSLARLLDAAQADVGGSTDWAVHDYFAAIEESGFPGIRTAHPRLRRALLDGYLRRIVDRDLPELGVSVRRPETLRRWLNAYAAASSTTTSYSRLLDAASGGDGSQPAKSTTIAYRDHLTQLWLLDPVPGWSPSRSPLTRLQQAPKHQLADPGLAARALGLSARTLLSPSGAHLAGPFFESLATLTVRVAAQAAEATVGHLRTRNGDHEVDLIVEGPEAQIVAFEVKMSASIGDADVKHLLWLRDQLPEQVVDLVVLTTGVHAYRRRDGVAVVPLALLGP
ncbi:ATP-binding protein [Propionibacteriaceae bacterium G1746]|uniref:ATP-binding protein n=1 Tax=Aestuariimicrobium sp. G57 TaxID=3418485 RepID=UPI003C2A7BC4